jgi:predicted neutral ceramidase superfamily lipid hydrolase
VSDKITDINESNLYIKFWSSPFKTLDYVLANCSKKYLIFLLLIGCIAYSICHATIKDIYSISLQGVLLSTVASFLLTLLYTWILSITGRLMNGEANASNYRTVFAWSFLPIIGGVVIIVPMALLFEEISLVVFIGVIIWIMFLIVKGISIIQGFGIIKSLLNLFTAGLIVLMALAMLGLFSRYIHF